MKRIIILLIFSQLLIKSQSQEINNPHLLIDNSGREMMFNIFLPESANRTCYGFNMALDGQLFKIPVNFGINEIRFQLGGAFRLSFQGVNSDFIDKFYSDTNNLEKLTESHYTVYTPYVYTDIRLHFTEKIALIPTIGYYYGFGSILWENADGEQVEIDDYKIDPKLSGLMYGLTLKLGPVGISYKIFADNTHFYEGPSIDVGLKF